MTAARPAESRPERWWGDHLGEARWLLEGLRLAVDPVWLGRGAVPRGDGRGVVLVPGFLAGDQTLAPLAGWLARLGYRPRTCGFIANVDCSERALERVERRVTALAQQTGRRVAVIGHSRGGHFARAIAARRPELVSHAIALGSDLQTMFQISAPTMAAVKATRSALHRSGRARRAECLTGRCRCAFAAGFTAAFPTDTVRLTSIYSRGDGVVRWQAMLVPDADCVEVTGSHIGLIVNRKSYRAIALALGTPER